MGKSCYDCIHKSVCDAYERKGLTDFEKGNVTPCELFAPKKRYIKLPFEFGGTVFHLEARSVNGRIAYSVAKIKVDRESVLKLAFSLWNDRYFLTEKKAKIAKERLERL